MVNPEQVLIDIRANDYASEILSKLGKSLSALQNIGKSISMPNINGGNQVTAIAYDFNQVQNGIMNAQKALRDFNNTPKTSPSSSNSLSDAYKELERLRNSAQKNIRIKIDSGEVNNAQVRVRDTERLVNNVRARMSEIVQNASQSFAGSPQSRYTPNFQMVGMSYDPTKLLGSGEGTYGSKPLVDLSKSYDNASKSASNFSKATQNAGKSSYSSFHQLNNMMVVVGGTFNDLSTKVAGIFGAAGLSGMIEKMWAGASQRQQNMMYLMHQKGKEQATTYYNEIMDIVTQLPGDDTFLTNILNMASAMDSSLKLDNLESAGRAITDYYMSATMKGENSYETQKDLRKYITTGDTRGMRNSVIASELDLLKNRNTVLERTQALEKALKNTGFDGMSGYESASNQLEELKGHFQKAFADLGEVILAVTQPLMKFYNTMDTIFGGRISQLIIVFATILVGIFATIGGGLIILSSSFRMIETITLGMEALSFAMSMNNEQRGIFNTLLMMSMSLEEREKYLKGEITLATWGETVATIKNTLARRLGVVVAEGEIVTNRALVVAIFNKIRAKVGEVIAVGNVIYMTISDIFWTWRNTDAKLSEAITEQLNTLAKHNNSVAIATNSIAKLRSLITTLSETGAKVLDTVVEWLSTESVFANTIARVMNINAKIGEIGATLGLASAVGVLNAMLAPELIAILAIVGAILLLIVAFEKVGEALGWWKDFGSLIESISNGISRLWNAFMGSDVIQGIIAYFQNFVTSIQYVFDSINNALSMLFGWDNSNTGTFDIVQTIIDLFGTLGDTIKWVWDLINDWADSPLGFITWLNPLGIIMFHLDEIGSLFEDIADAIDRFTGTTEFQELMEGLGEVWEELQAPFQEIASLIDEIMQMFGELFGGGSDPNGRGTEDRINLIVELLKGIATVIRVVVLPIIRIIATVIRAILTPIRVVLYVIGGIVSLLKGASEFLGGIDVIWESFIAPLRFIYDSLRQVIDAVIWLFSLVGTGVGESILFIVNAISSAIQGIIKLFSSVGQIFSGPLGVVLNIIERISALVTTTSKVIKNSFIGKLLGWDKEDDKSDSNKNKYNGNIRKSIGNSDITRNVNNVRNLGRTYNNTNNQRQVVINQNFSEGSMPIDARNMTKKEAKKMFVGAFGYNRTVGKHGILR